VPWKIIWLNILSTTINPCIPSSPNEDIMTLFEEKLDEDRDKWIVWFDGASNILGHGVGGSIGLSGQ